MKIKVFSSAVDETGQLPAARQAEINQYLKANCCMTDNTQVQATSSAGVNRTGNSFVCVTVAIIHLSLLATVTQGATNCSFWGFACAAIEAPTQEAAVASLSDFTVSDAWRVGHGSPVFTAPQPVTVWGDSRLEPDPWLGQRGVLGTIKRSAFPADWSTQPNQTLYHWWVLDSPTHGEFVGFDQYGANYFNSEGLVRLVALNDRLSVFQSGEASWSIYYASATRAIAPEPSLSLLLFVPLLWRRERNST